MPGTVKLQSSDGKLFEIDHETGMQMETVRDIYDSIGDDDTVLPLPGIKSKTLLPILQWCEYHKNDDYLKNVTIFCPTTWDEPPKGVLDIDDPFDKEFINVPESQLLDYMMAANFLAIDHLLNFIAKAISDKLRNKTTKEVRELFGLKNDKRTSAMEVYQRMNSDDGPSTSAMEICERMNSDDGPSTSAMEICERMNSDDRPRTSSGHLISLGMESSFTEAEKRKGIMVEGELWFPPPPKRFKR